MEARNFHSAATGKTIAFFLKSKSRSGKIRVVDSSYSLRRVDGLGLGHSPVPSPLRLERPGVLVVKRRDNPALQLFTQLLYFLL